MTRTTKLSRTRLRYSSDNLPGYQRRRTGRGFNYLTAAGKTIKQRQTLDRIKTLAIPPAWTDVWICPWPNGHLQATGRDARGRKQYVYHPTWTDGQGTAKFDRIARFGRALPMLRHRLRRDLKRPGLPRQKVLAAVIRLLEQTMIRVGNKEYAQANGSFGMTTLRDHHAKVNGATIQFQFRGKSGLKHAVKLSDGPLARIVAKCQDLPGQELFQYLDDRGRRRTITSGDVNEYIRRLSHEDFSAKDFRTWAGTILAARTLRQNGNDGPPVKSAVQAAIKEVASQLGNTPSICRKSYIHPTVISTYLDGRLDAVLPTCGNGAARSAPSVEKAVLRMLERASRAR